MQFLALFLQFLLESPVDLPCLLPDLSQILFDRRVFFDFFPNEHERKAYQQQPAGDPDGLSCQPRCAHASNTGTHREQQNDAKITHHPVLNFRFMGLAPDAECFHTAAQVTNAHGAGKCIAVHLAERLHLHCAGEGNDGVCQQVLLLWQKANNEQQKHFAQHHQLPPVKPLHVAKALPHLFCHQYAQRKSTQRNQIVQHPIPLTIHDVGTQQHDVAGLCICKHLTAEQIRIGILQPARKRKEHRRQEGL